MKVTGIGHQQVDKSNTSKGVYGKYILLFLETEVHKKNYWGLKFEKNNLGNIQYLAMPLSLFNI